MSPSASEDSAPEEHAVLLEWEDGEPPLDFILAVEDRLMEVVDSQPGIGEVDGNEVGSDTATIYLYGPDCEHLWSAIEPTVRGLEPTPTRVTIRPGGPDTPGRDLTLR
ncbi:hypothetical protein [Mycolicibacterium smegmatis]|uniref:Uncharacterized protein n=1 Tax=Mycolicibacterium smegmatis (strain MKD8) TaxID=1214915 RepID=A0A2U9PJ85_MYCSE|nr:hypothetical protein [Mycolicibacterium smegmatis]AWT51810.1 hypothetical protein D806_008200 [Mycolicibacterium smegmatis MKD8]